MLRLAAAVAAALLFVAPLVRAQEPASPKPGDTAVAVTGTGAAHGMGLAMDGVLGQARAGWKYTRILDLFYEGTSTSKARGTMRVGLAPHESSHTFELPGGGAVSDAPPGSAPGPGYPLHVPAGGVVVVSHADGRYRVDAPGVVRAAQLPLPSPQPLPSAAPGEATPVPTPAPDATPGREPDPSRAAARTIWITPDGDPALTRVAATGRRYRGRIEVRFTQALWAVNHVDLETYVRGIAEEKGAGWPVEGLKVLAVAARSLAVATSTWYARHHVNGFDICPTSMCQVYLGYDGEEDRMTQATNATAGEIRTHAGRAILAMYHGNGGGRTESYSLVYAGGTADPHPYLKSVAYPFANPRHWTREFSSSQVADALRAAKLDVRGGVTGVTVVRRGHSPRVLQLRVDSPGGSVETTGLRFQGALGLPSSWFDVHVGGSPPPDPDPIVPDDAGALASADDLPRPEPRAASASAPPRPRRPDALAAATLALAATIWLVVYVGRRNAAQTAARNSSTASWYAGLLTTLRWRPGTVTALADGSAPARPDGSGASGSPSAAITSVGSDTLGRSMAPSPDLGAD